MIRKIIEKFLIDSIVALKTLNVPDKSICIKFPSNFEFYLPYVMSTSCLTKISHYRGHKIDYDAPEFKVYVYDKDRFKCGSDGYFTLPLV